MKKNKSLVIVEYIIYLVITRILYIIPRRLAYISADFLGILAFRLNIRTKVAMTNLDIAYGDKLSIKEKKLIIKKCFQNFVKASFDFVTQHRFSEEEIFDLVKIEGKETADAAFARGNGVIILGFHYGNWELIPLIHRLLELPPVNIIARRMDNPYIEKEITAIRSATGNKYIHKDKAARTIFSSLRKNHSVGIMFDQNTAIGGIFVDFFNKQAATNKALGSFALSTNAAILPIVCLPQSDRSYKIIYGPEVTYQSTEDREKDILTISRKCNLFIEETIMKHPEFWLWGHKRWKNRPEGEDRFY